MNMKSLFWKSINPSISVGVIFPYLKPLKSFSCLAKSLFLIWPRLYIEHTPEATEGVSELVYAITKIKDCLPLQWRSTWVSVDVKEPYAPPRKANGAGLV